MKNDVVGVKRLGDRIIALKFVAERDTFNVISAYASQLRLEEHYEVKLWGDLEGLVQGVPLGEKMWEANTEDKTILDFPLAFKFTITNTCFQKWRNILSHIEVE